MADYPYYYLPSKPRPVLKPLVKVMLNYKKTHKVTPEITALIDSGADVCFCADYIGLWLGINLRKIKEEESFTAANGKDFQAKKEIISLRLASKLYECPFFFTSVLPKETPLILGQYGFFDHFKITFDARNKLISIT